MSDEAYSDIKVELYGTVFTIKQMPCWYGDEALFTETLKLQVYGHDAFLAGRRVSTLRGDTPVRHKFKVPYEWAWELRDSLRRMKLVVHPDFVVGCDGGYTEFSFVDSGCRGCWRWWSEVPYSTPRSTAYAPRSQKS